MLQGIPFCKEGIDSCELPLLEGTGREAALGCAATHSHIGKFCIQSSTSLLAELYKEVLRCAIGAPPIAHYLAHSYALPLIKTAIHDAVECGAEVCAMFCKKSRKIVALTR